MGLWGLSLHVLVIQLAETLWPLAMRVGERYLGMPSAHELSYGTGVLASVNKMS